MRRMLIDHEALRLAIEGLERRVGKNERDIQLAIKAIQSILLLPDPPKKTSVSGSVRPKRRNKGHPHPDDRTPGIRPTACERLRPVGDRHDRFAASIGGVSPMAGERNLSISLYEEDIIEAKHNKMIELFYHNQNSLAQDGLKASFCKSCLFNGL